MQTKEKRPDIQPPYGKKKAEDEGSEPRPPIKPDETADPSKVKQKDRSKREKSER